MERVSILSAPSEAGGAAAAASVAAAKAAPASDAARLGSLVARLRFFRTSDSVPFLFASLNLCSKDAVLLGLSVLAGGVSLAVLAASVGGAPAGASAGAKGSVAVSVGASVSLAASAGVILALGGVSRTVITGTLLGVAMTQYGPSFMMSFMSLCFEVPFFAFFISFAGATPSAMFRIATLADDNAGADFVFKMSQTGFMEFRSNMKLMLSLTTFGKSLSVMYLSSSRSLMTTLVVVCSDCAVMLVVVRMGSAGGSSGEWVGGAEVGAERGWRCSGWLRAGL